MTAPETPIDHPRLRAALEALDVSGHPFLDPALGRYYVAKVAAADTYEQLFAPNGAFDADPATLGDCLAVALAAARVLSAPCPQKTTASLELPSRHTAHVVVGDLHVDGDLIFSGRLVVLGDVVVSRTIQTRSEHATLWVTGAITARGIKADNWCNSVYADKTISTPDVIAASQTIAARSGIETRLLLEYDGFWSIRGPLKTTTRIHADDLDEQIEYPDSVLRQLLVPALFEPSTELAPAYALAANMFDALSRGLPIFRA